MRRQLAAFVGVSVSITVWSCAPRSAVDENPGAGSATGVTAGPGAGASVPGGTDSTAGSGAADRSAGDPGARGASRAVADPGANGTAPVVARADDGSAAAARRGSGDSGDSGAPAGWRLLEVGNVRIAKVGERFLIEVESRIPTASWTTELRARSNDAPTLVAEYVLVGQSVAGTAASPAAPAGAHVTRLEVELPDGVSTIVITGRDAGGEQSVIEEVPRS